MEMITFKQRARITQKLKTFLHVPFAANGEKLRFYYIFAPTII